MTSGSNCRHLNKPQTEEARRSIQPAYHGLPVKLQHCRPCYVDNRSSKSVVPDHPLDVQAFHSNLAVARDQVVGNFVSVFSAKVSHSSVQPVDLSTLLCPVASTLFLVRGRSLRTPQLRQIAFQKSRVGNLFSVRSRRTD